MTTETNTAEQNRGLATWMGHKPYNSNCNRNYHNDWNLLMSVVENIESIGYEVDICGYECTINEIGRNTFENANMIFITADTKLSATYQAVCEFIKQFNQSKP